MKQLKNRRQELTDEFNQLALEVPHVSERLKILQDKLKDKLKDLRDSKNHLQKNGRDV